jgi:hypothetical protein
MSGVTHFERRDRQKFIHDVCHFCGKVIKGTPKKLAGSNGDDWEFFWLSHVRDHILQFGMTADNLDKAMRTAMAVAREFDRNK